MAFLLEAEADLKAKGGNPMENAGYLFAAFSAIWAAVFGCVLVLSNRQKKLPREIDSLTELLNEKDIEQ